MPSRIVVLCIVAFWAATLAWFYVRDVALRVETDEPVFFPVDRADELTKRQGAKKHIWSANRRSGQREEHYFLTTFVVYNEVDDNFEMKGQLNRAPQDQKDRDKDQNDREILKAAKLPLLKVEMDSRYRYDRDSRLTALVLDTQYDLATPRDPEVAKLHKSLTLLDAAPRDNYLSPTVRDVGDNVETALGTIEISRRGTVLNPLHPVHRIQGLRTEQTWKCTAIDPFYIGAIRAQQMATEPDAGWNTFLGGKRPALQTLNARVGRELQELQWLGSLYPCFVIEFASDDRSIQMTTFVRASDGLVYDQKATVWGEEWAFRRSKEP